MSSWLLWKREQGKSKEEVQWGNKDMAMSCGSHATSRSWENEEQVLPQTFQKEHTHQNFDSSFVKISLGSSTSKVAR